MEMYILCHYMLEVCDMLFDFGYLRRDFGLLNNAEAVKDYRDL